MYFINNHNYYFIFIVLNISFLNLKSKTQLISQKSSYVAFYNYVIVSIFNRQFNMKPAVAADEMFPEGTSAIMDLDDETASNVIFEISDKNQQADFYNDFNDLNDDDEF